MSSIMDTINFNEDKHFYGDPCVKCGNEIRYIKNGKCFLCIRNRNSKWRKANPEKRREQNRRYEKKYPEKVRAKARRLYHKDLEKSRKKGREKSLRWRKNNLEKARAKNKEWSDANPEKVSEINRNWKRENPEKVKANAKRYYRNNRESICERSRIYYLENREEMLQRNRESYYRRYRENPTKVNARLRKRRAQKANAYHEPYDFVEICEMYGNVCLACGCDDSLLTIDHVIPISKGGADAAFNIQPLCKSCNSRKNVKCTDYRSMIYA